MDKLSRRQMLRGGAAAVGLTAAAGLQQKLAAHGVNQIGIASHTGMEVPITSSGRQTFKNFLGWWNEFGEKWAQDAARHVSCFDADILEMKSPSLQAKFNMQRLRNIKRLKVEKKKDFERRLSTQGFYEWWP